MQLTNIGLFTGSVGGKSQIIRLRKNDILLCISPRPKHGVFTLFSII